MFLDVRASAAWSCYEEAVTALLRPRISRAPRWWSLAEGSRCAFILFGCWVAFVAANAEAADGDAGTSRGPSATANAEVACEVLTKGFVYFDTRKQEWFERDELKLRRCGDRLDLLLHDAKTLAKKDLAHPKAAPAGTAWQLAGLSCARRGVKAASRAIDLLVLSERVSEGAALRPVDAWTVNPKSSKLVQVPAAQVVCGADEP